jgi:antitoxin CptB
VNERLDRERLRWRCRRGARELDILLERYCDERMRDADPRERAAFERLLGQPDPVLYEWLILGRPPPRHLEDLVERVRTSPGARGDTAGPHCAGSS